MSPKIVVAKIIMRQIFEDRTVWDECLELVTFSGWLEFVDDYSYIDKIDILRWVNCNYQREVLHAICYASAAILYSRVLTPSGDFVTHLLAAKVPRLEPYNTTLLARKGIFTP